MKKVLEIFNMSDWAFLRRGYEKHSELYGERSGKVFMFDNFAKRWMQTNIRDTCKNIPIEKIWNTRKCRTEDYHE